MGESSKKKYMRYFFLMGILTLSLFSCKKDDNCFPFDGCSEKNAITDSAVIVQKLIGKWKEVYQPCGWSNDNDAALRKINVRLSIDGTYSITDRGQLFAQGKWSIYKLSSSPLTWMIHSSPHTSYLGGKVVLCSSNLILTGTFIADNMQYDGCANYYCRSN
jgi:hypothetical protein